MLSTQRGLLCGWLLVLAVRGFSDPFIAGTWSVQGLGKINATFMTHVCIKIEGDKATETWYMRSILPEQQQQELGTDAVEVKYDVLSDITYNVTAPTPWVYSANGLVPPGQEAGSPGSMIFSATAVNNVKVFPAQFSAAMTAEREKIVGRSRKCLYGYTGAPSRLTLNLGCSSQRPAEGFYRYGETDSFPSAMAQDHAKLSRARTCEGSSEPATWPVHQDGYRIEVALAAEMAQVTSDQYPGILRALAIKINIPATDLALVQVVPGSVVLRAFYPSNRNPELDAQLEVASTRLSVNANEKIAGRPVIALSFQWSAGATIVISDADDDGRLRPVVLPLMILVCLLGVGLFFLALYLLVSDEKDSLKRLLFKS